MPIYMLDNLLAKYQGSIVEGANKKLPREYSWGGLHLSDLTPNANSTEHAIYEARRSLANNLLLLVTHEYHQTMLKDGNTINVGEPSVVGVKIVNGVASEENFPVFEFKICRYDNYGKTEISLWYGPGESALRLDFDCNDNGITTSRFALEIPRGPDMHKPFNENDYHPKMYKVEAKTMDGVREPQNILTITDNQLAELMTRIGLPTEILVFDHASPEKGTNSKIDPFLVLLNRFEDLVISLQSRDSDNLLELTG